MMEIKAIKSLQRETTVTNNKNSFMSTAQNLWFKMHSDYPFVVPGCFRCFFEYFSWNLWKKSIPINIQVSEQIKAQTHPDSEM